MGKPRIRAAPLTQQTFPFVSNVEVQEMAQAHEGQQRRRLARIFEHTKLASINIESLIGSVFTRKGEKYLKALDKAVENQVEIEFVFNKEPTARDKAEDVELFLDNFSQFLGCALDTILESLADVGGVEEKIDTLEWIYAGNTRTIGARVKGKDKLVLLDRIPMSFNWVCRALGLCPDVLRSGIELSLRESQRAVDARMTAGSLNLSRGHAIGAAVNFINERSTHEC